MNMNDRNVKPWSSRQGRAYDYAALEGKKYIQQYAQEIKG